MSDTSPETRRFLLTVSYDGRPFSGWQSQAGGNTVQDLLLEGLRGICPAVSTVQGAGRTDAGVSAEAQAAHFDTPGSWRMNPGEWTRALNSRLPPTIRIVCCREVDPTFHARFDAKGKIYRYEIATGDILPPLRHGLAWHEPRLSDAAAVKAALSCFEGRHDFRAFSANRNDGHDESRDTVRTIDRATWTAGDDTSWSVTVEGDGFLYKMVRFLVGTAVYHSLGRIRLDEIRNLLAHPETNSAKAPYCAPPDGLRLVAVRYGVELREK